MSTVSRPRPVETDEDAVLRTIVQGTSTSTGQPFFDALVSTLSAALDTYGAWVAEYLQETRQLRAIAMRLGDEWTNGAIYGIDGTPCQTAIETDRQVHIPQNVLELYPTDPDLAPHDAVSYMGVPLKDADGRIIGQLAVLDNKPMPPEPRCMAVFRIFADRAAAELRRLRAEEATRERENQLSLLLDSAMDAIINLDDQLRIALINSSAEEVLGCKAANVVGRRVGQFLSNASQGRLRDCAAELAEPRGPRYLWIAGGLEALTDSGELFRAEATLSRYEMHGEVRYTMILRNVNDRLEAEQRIRALTQETHSLREGLRSLQEIEEIVGDSQPLLRALHDVEQVAEAGATVLILGETGTGKELFASAIHASSPRRDRPLIRVNCAAIPTNLIESEFFGHEKGAFTGATTMRVGRFALAHGSSLFLDEVGELPLALQAKLLRVLQEGELEPVGSSKTVKVDVRIIAATNRDLARAVECGEFREDLFYRLNVFPIKIPPLRERGDDIILLAERYASEFARRIGRDLLPLTETCKARLGAYHWPGNVRELRNVIERAVIVARDGRLDLVRALPGDVSPRIDETDTLAGDPMRVRTSDELKQIERDNILRALELTGWKVAGDAGAASLLGLNSSTLASRMRALGIRRPAKL
jgi:PAS domain S-box-containing protein